DKLIPAIGYYAHREGFWRGWGRFIKEFIPQFCWYVSVIPYDYAAGAEQGWEGFSEFVRAPRTAFRLRMPFETVLRLNRQTLREGMLWVVLTAVGMQFDHELFAYMTSSTFILVALAWMF